MSKICNILPNLISYYRKLNVREVESRLDEQCYNCAHPYSSEPSSRSKSIPSPLTDVGAEF